MHYPSFSACLGASQYTGLLSFEQRLQTLSIDCNPYQSKTALAANSPVFVGRKRELHAFHQALSAPNPAAISVEGEPRIGKSSLLNQVVAQLQQYDNLITLRCDAQGMGKTDQSHFFAGLASSIIDCLGHASPDNLPKSYNDFLAIIQKYAQQYRFVLVLDEFEVLADNPIFDKIFFDNLRSLGNNPDNCFGFLIASHNTLESLCHRGHIKGSRFYNIFDVYILGLLEIKATRQLIQLPLDFLNISIDSDTLRKVYIRHPYYLQMGLAEIINAQQLEFDYDPKRIKNNMLATMQDLWLRRTPAEVNYLFQAIAQQKLPNDHIRYVLESRGLLIVENNKSRLFANLFKYSLPNSLLPSGYSLNQYLKIISQNPENSFQMSYSKTVWERIKSMLEEVGKLYQYFKPSN